MLKKKKLEIPNEMGVGTMAWGDEKAGFVSDPKYRPKQGEFNPADLQVRTTVDTLIQRPQGTISPACAS